MGGENKQYLKPPPRSTLPFWNSFMKKHIHELNLQGVLVLSRVTTPSFPHNSSYNWWRGPPCTYRKKQHCLSTSSIFMCLVEHGQKNEGITHKKKESKLTRKILMFQSRKSSLSTSFRHLVIKNTPWKINGWKQKIHPFRKGKPSEPNLHFSGSCR